MKILLIAGHGAGDSGAVATIDGTYYKEADLTREVVNNLKPLLEEYGCTVGVYPTNRNAYTDYKNGVLNSNAKFSNYDYTLEIHFNACVQDYSGNGKTTGVECYWASRGKETGFELPMTSRIAKLGLRQRTNQSMQLAVINNSYLAGTAANLLEVCFIDDADDMRIYLKNKTAIAQAIADGIAAVKGLKKKEVETVEETKKGKYFTDTVGHWAEEYIDKCKEAGIMQGIGNDKFAPNDNVTRAQLAVVVSKLLDKING